MLIPAFFLLLSGCTEKEEKIKTIEYSNYYSNELPVLLQPVQFSGDISGRWSHNVFLGESVISFEKNGRFYYYEVGCTAKYATAGNWVFQGPQIILNSDEAYAKEDEIECATKIVYEETPDELEDSSTTISKFRVKFPDLSRVTFVSSFKKPDTSKLYFTNERFILRGGRLLRDYPGSTEQYQKMTGIQ